MHLEWREVAPGDGPAILTSVATEEATELARLAKGQDVLEIGSARGYSACVMALAGARSITAIDPHMPTWLGDTRSQMRANLDAYGVADRVEIIQAYSFDAMPALIEQERRFGLVFVDGDHAGPVAEQDLGYAAMLTGPAQDSNGGQSTDGGPGGIICVHDFLEHCCCPEVLHAANRVFPDGPSRIIATMAVYELS